MQLDGLSLSALVAELHNQLTGGRIDRIFQLDAYSILLWVRNHNQDFPVWLSAAPSQPDIQILSKIPENPAAPPAFCMLLRKHLEDGRIMSISQQGLDRIIHLDIDIRGEGGRIITKTLVVELMGKHSNIILVQDALIIDSVRRVSYQLSRFRQVLPNRPYLPPPGQERLPAAETPWPEIQTALLTLFADLPLHKALLQAVNGLGPVSIREILWRAGLPQQLTPARLEESDWRALQDAWQELFAQLLAAEYEPTVATSDEGRFLAAAGFKLHHLSEQTLHTFPSMAAATDFARALNPAPRRAPKQEELLHQVADLLQRQKHKYPLLQQELTAAEDCDQWRRAGDILMSHLHLVPAGKSEVTLPDIYSEDASASITLALQPLRTAIDNAQAYYNRYTKGKRAQELLRQQLSQCSQDIAYLESVLHAAEQAETLAEFAEIRLELISQGYQKAEGKKKPSQLPAKPLSLKTPNGTALLIGKNNRQNDLVTFKLSQTNDLWFHTKDIPGSHVILRTEGAAASESDLHTAALLAAHFSKSRGSSNVPVDYTQRRYVKKPNGAKPGFVIYDHQQTLYVTPDEKILANYLK